MWRGAVWRTNTEQLFWGAWCGAVYKHQTVVWGDRCRSFVGRASFRWRTEHRNRGACGCCSVPASQEGCADERGGMRGKGRGPLAFHHRVPLPEAPLPAFKGAPCDRCAPAVSISQAARPLGSSVPLASMNPSLRSTAARCRLSCLKLHRAGLHGRGENEGAASGATAGPETPSDQHDHAGPLLCRGARSQRRQRLGLTNPPRTVAS